MANETVQFVCIMFADLSAKRGGSGGGGTQGGSLASLTPQIAELVERYGGQQTRAMGTTVRSAFHDVKAAIACACALEAKWSPESGDAGGGGPSLRIGLHAGEATLRGENFAGEVVMIAARLALIAEHHQIVCTGTVFEHADAEYQQSMTPLPKSSELEIRKNEVDLYNLSWQEHVTEDTKQAAEVPAAKASGKGPIRLSPKMAKNASSTQKVSLSATVPRQSRPRAAANAAAPPSPKPVSEPQSASAGPPALASDICLSLYSEGNQVAVVNASKDKVSLGRAEHCDITLDVPTASRHHADIVLHNGSFYLIDHSINGTFLYDETDNRSRVHHEQVILEDYGFICVGCSRTNEHAKPLEFLIDSGDEGS